MAKNYIKLINDMKKDIPLLKDFIYEDFNLINDYELTNAIKFESFIRTDEIKTLIKNIEQELISIEEKRTINLLKKKILMKLIYFIRTF